MDTISHNFLEMKSYKIAILLATYNSAEFVREQLDSLFSQTNQEWVLYVRDDCSTDETISIIHDYQKKYEGRVVIVDNKGKSLRAYLNFVELLKAVEADYYFFCDHDDVWLPEKIQLSMDRMLELEHNNYDRPIVVHTDMKVVDQDLNIICDSFWEYSRLLPEKTSFLEMVLCNSANGCAMLFNKKAKEVALPNVANATMHDMLVNQSVSAENGIISPIYQPAVLYRQHVDNVIGAQKRNLFFQLKRFFNLKYLFKANVDNWKKTRNIKDYSLAEYIWVKFKIMIYKVQKYYK